MIEKMRQWMEHRLDAFGWFLLSAALGLFVIGLCFSQFLIALAAFILLYEIYRILRPGVEKRREENAAYLQMKARVKAWLAMQKSRFDGRNTYRYFQCPSCRQSLRVPKGRGTVMITCPKCHAQFEKKS